MLLAEYFLLNSFLAQFFIAQSTDCKSSCNSLSFNLINPFGVSVHRSRSTTFKGSTKNDPVSVFSLLYIKDFSPPHRRRWANMRANMNPCKLTKTKKKIRTQHETERNFLSAARNCSHRDGGERPEEEMALRNAVSIELASARRKIRRRWRRRKIMLRWSVHGLNCSKSENRRKDALNQYH